MATLYQMTFFNPNYVCAGITDASNSPVAPAQLTNVIDSAQLKRERDQYAAEKRVLLDLLSAQCDEVDVAEKAKREAVRSVIRFSTL